TGRSAAETAMATISFMCIHYLKPWSHSWPRRPHLLGFHAWPSLRTRTQSEPPRIRVPDLCFTHGDFDEISFPRRRSYASKLSPRKTGEIHTPDRSRCSGFRASNRELIPTSPT